MTATGVETDDLVTGLLELLQRTDQVRRTGDGQPGGGTGGGTPGHRGHGGRTTLRDDHTVATERGDGADDRAEVARVGDVVEDDDEPRAS